MAILARNGFTEAHSMEGGITAWEGSRAAGPPEAGIAYFTPADDAGEMTALAWSLEHNTRKLYMALNEIEILTGSGDIFSKLASAEDHHKQALEEFYYDRYGKPLSLLTDRLDLEILEGGARLAETLAWVDGRSFPEILHMALALEANAYDRYLQMINAADDEDAKDIFRMIAREEKDHLKLLGDLLDSKEAE
ncbi:MAG: ferritin family protein [bacterium]